MLGRKGGRRQGLGGRRWAALSNGDVGCWAGHGVGVMRASRAGELESPAQTLQKHVGLLTVLREPAPGPQIPPLPCTLDPVGRWLRAPPSCVSFPSHVCSMASSWGWGPLPAAQMRKLRLVGGLALVCAI